MRLFISKGRKQGKAAAQRMMAAALDAAHAEFTCAGEVREPSFTLEDLERASEAFRTLGMQAAAAQREYEEALRRLNERLRQVTGSRDLAGMTVVYDETLDPDAVFLVRPLPDLYSRPLFIEPAIESAILRPGRGDILNLGPALTNQSDEQVVAFGEPYELDKCWRQGCGAPIPREDDIGLCDPCKAALRGGPIPTESQAVDRL